MPRPPAKKTDGRANNGGWRGKQGSRDALRAYGNKGWDSVRKCTKCALPACSYSPFCFWHGHGKGSASKPKPWRVEARAARRWARRAIRDGLVPEELQRQWPWRLALWRPVMCRFLRPMFDAWAEPGRPRWGSVMAEMERTWGQKYHAPLGEHAPRYERTTPRNAR